jgi:hypothetical protein
MESSARYVVDAFEEQRRSTGRKRPWRLGVT